MSFIKQPRRFLASFTTHCTLMFNLLSTRKPRTFSAKLLCDHASMYWCVELFLSRYKTLNISRLL